LTSHSKILRRKRFSSQPVEDLFSNPLIYTNSVTAACDGAYLPIPSMEKLKAVLDAKLIEYNESNAMMDLVLFKQAMLHITRISRIIQNPGGNAILISDGGSGKQSLTRLTAFINNFEVKQLIITSNFTVEDLKENLKNMYLSAGVKGNPIVFLVTDSQISDEQFLVYINSMLTTGWIADLFPKEEIDNTLEIFISS
jgi:dynein heavy chain